MKDYYFLFQIFAYINSGLLLIYFLYFIKKSSISADKELRIVVFYLWFSCFFDVLSRLIQYLLEIGFINEFHSISLRIMYRLGELVFIGYIINKYWLKSKMAWLLIGASGLFLVYDLFTYRVNGVLNYMAYAQITANTLLVCLLVVNLLKQLQGTKKFSITNQMLNMVFLAYFAVHLIYTVIMNFIINQKYSDKSFALFYCSYAVLHILYYFALAFIVYKKQKSVLKK
ncbi:hypothetical protein H1R17_02355 [Flavobacterium sp. xlx-214]|uniref:hypothetical protein n=1 Tax=unclassified Flavobacterium TaxID=196869 RepID=UPI0013D834B7|nr:MULTISPECIES: hypothetical protein [unclassified Flavobacterium]MBA5794092.1 hypothetical protein [Flavobacterium sp. xlx-221]QMI84001.1 hypothetical protein H1R17_02355 [Flavobacterium sp. xlx-214]